jgi:hypothetical protein
MVQKSYFAHNSPEGLTPWHWFKEAGYDFTYAGENLAVNFGDSIDVNRAWMNSPLHRANILNGHFTEIGIATAEGIYEGRPTIFVVQLFGKPAVKKPASETLVSTTATASVKETSTVVAATSSLVTTVSSTVLGESGENELYIAVEKESMVVAVEKITQNSQSSFFEKVLASPQSTLGIIYVALAFIIILALILMVCIEIRRQHPLHILYALLLLMLVGILFYIYRDVVFTPLLIL